MIENKNLRASFVVRRPMGKRGQTLVEYSLILALISVVAIAALINMGGQVKGVYTTIDRQLTLAGSGGQAAAPPPTAGP
jgi:Flp pilus assembly pilin Flp